MAVSAVVMNEKFQLKMIMNLEKYFASVRKSKRNFRGSCVEYD